jgi:hypothetical protein
MTASAIARHANGARARARNAEAGRKSTAYGRAVWRALKEMQKAGPWEFGPRVSDRVFKKS